MNNNYPAAPLNISSDVSFIKKLVLSINYLMNGKTNNTGEFTTDITTTSTIVKNTLCNENSVILITPVTANAAIHMLDSYIVAGDKQFTYHHQAKTHTDRTFRYVIIG